ncbi:hypothetical protein GHNINEIG_01080 [Hydrogenovibrio crunogenus]|uniref:Uncharacterized protein n=1 Tax=Hydrogenovibrio crunogenus TaxID=39765 RepID=A0A4P7NZK1_9GAMM|nr:hypothetical protein [Hydrogenovibrio crunogenus]QBZ83039.1 hypothetical protein GHNINEIG_01080 [Hydrogenovibrio crunogenus]
MDHSAKPARSSGKEALKKAIIFSIPLFILNYLIVSHLIQDIGLPYFLSAYQPAFYLLFNFILDFIIFNIVLIAFHKLEHHRMTP